ncbi:MAG: ABC transporter permease, partial [Candidatus Neomarinimicrobiota bacterium]
MIRNYIKVALRNILRYKIFAFINIAGLVIGMTACLLILLFIKNELSYENMHGDLEKMHRVLTIDKALGTNNQRVGITMPGLGPAIATNFPEVEATHRLTFGSQTLLKYQDRLAIYANQLRSADANFFSFFDYPLLIGNPATVLESPYSIVLTETLAHQIFGNEEAVGQTLTAGGGYDMLVTGIMADLPENTHLEFDALQSISTITANANPNQPPFLESWQIIAMPTYVKFREAIDPKPFDEKFTQLCRDNNVAPNFDITLQPLSRTHLWSTDVIFDPVANKGDNNNIYIFGAIAVLILIIASVNYINLSTARSAQRAKEVGLRKVVGSSRSQLLLQFITESLLISGIALLLVLPLAQLATP